MVPNRKSSSKSGSGMDNGAYTVTESDSSSGRGSESRSRRNSRRYIHYIWGTVNIPNVTTHST